MVRLIEDVLSSGPNTPDSGIAQLSGNLLGAEGDRLDIDRHQLGQGFPILSETEITLLCFC